jgi:excisionase family DNA binding protein
VGRAAHAAKRVTAQRKAKKDLCSFCLTRHASRLTLRLPLRRDGAHTLKRATEQHAMPYSLAEAAEACGVNRSTILRSIKAGRLSAQRDALGQWRIEPGELHRVYAPTASNGAHSNKTRDRATAALIEAQHRADLAEQRLSDLKNMLDDMTAQRDAWQQQAQATQRLLSDATARRPWWKRLAG